MENSSNDVQDMNVVEEDGDDFNADSDEEPEEDQDSNLDPTDNEDDLDDPNDIEDMAFEMLNDEAELVENVMGFVDISSVIKKVRKIVKAFRKSPIKNEILQKHISQEFSKELRLNLDIKIRWNSLIDMLERFLNVKSAILKAAKDLNMEIDLNEEEFEALQIIVQTLVPIKIGAEKLCKREINLLDSEIIFSFILSELNELKNPFSQAMKSSLIR